MFFSHTKPAPANQQYQPPATSSRTKCQEMKVTYIWSKNYEWFMDKIPVSVQTGFQIKSKGFYMPLKRYNVMQNTLSSFYTQAKIISLSITKPQVSQDPTGHICIRLSVQKKKSNDLIEISFLCFVSMLALAFIRLFLFCSTEHTGSWAVFSCRE